MLNGIMNTNQVILNIANNWRLDAKFEDPKYFYNYDEVNLILNNQKCYVIGRKGAGKTAICEHIVQNDSYDRFSSRLSFKNFPFNELYGLNNNKYTEPNQYITLWKYLIYSTICKMMVENQRIDPDVRSKLEILYPKNDLKLLNRKISEWTSAEFGATILGSGGNLKVSRSISSLEIPWIEKVNILEDVIVNYCDDSKYYIVFDELDEDYRDLSNVEESKNYINLLTSLFKATQDVKATFARTQHQIMPIVFLRDDIFMLINDSDKNKWSDLKIELEWTAEKIKKLLAHRISCDIGNGANEFIFNVAWEKVFAEKEIGFGTNKSKKIKTFDFILRSTHLRPRDFVRYIQGCCDYSKDTEELVSNNTIRIVDRAFSNYLRDEIKDEVYPLLPDIDNIFQVISNIRKWNLSVREFKQEYNKYLKAGTIKENNVDKVLDVLYNFSVIGNQHKFRKEIQFFKYQHTNMTYNKDENIVIHRGLFKSLQIE